MKSIGEFVVYRKDVCKIVEVKENSFNHKMCYRLIPVSDESLSLTIPVDNEHIRSLMTKEEVLDFVKSFKTIPFIDVEEKQLENEYKKLLNEESKESLAKIIKTTYFRNQERLLNNKKISDKDNRYFEMAENYLYHEIAVVLGLSFEEARKYVVDHVK